MRYSRYTLILLLILLTACGGKQPEKQEENRADYSAEALQWADSVMSKMTPEERVAQLFMPAAFTADCDSNLQRLREYALDRHVGGILFLKSDAATLAASVDTVQRLSAIPMLTAIDAEWGLAMRITDAPMYPMLGELPSDIDDQTMYDYGQELARQARIVGLNMLMAPVVDVVTSPGNVAIGRRSLGSDPERVATLAISFAQGLEDGNVISVAKHFPGHGGTLQDSHDTLPTVNIPRARLDSVDLLPFRRYISQNLSGIMIGHLYMPALDKVHRSAAVSPEVIDNLLRHSMQFHGLIITDALTMKGAQSKGSYSVDAIKAGTDIVLAPVNTEAEIRAVCDAVRRGEITPQQIDEKCRRILVYKYRFAREHYTAPDSATIRQGLYETASRKIQQQLRARRNFAF